MATDLELLRQPAHLSPAEALTVSQKAPTFLSKNSWSLPWPLSYLVSDAPEKWAAYENLFLSCLRTGDIKSAHACLKRLEDRFGLTNERVMGLVGLYHEAIAPHEDALKTVLKSYEEEITERPTDMVIRKRHIALLKSMDKSSGAIAALVDLLDASPTDAEAWAELAELYFARKMYDQAIYCVEEVLVIMPNAWNVHARIGEMYYTSTVNGENSDANRLRGYVRSMKSFCRSIELCDLYLRGFYGLKLVTSKIIDLLAGKPASFSSRDAADDDFIIPELNTVQRLNELATAKLAEIVRKHSLKTKGWTGYDEAEVIAARELLDRDSQQAVR